MWLKVHYPFDFYAVLLSLEPEKTPRAIKEALRFGVSVTNPDVNTSKKDFTIDFENQAIRYGLIGIDGIGETSAQQVMEKAPYESLLHFELSHSFKYTKVNKGHREALLEAGALDSLGARADWTDTQRATTELKRLKMSLRPGGTFGDDEDMIFRAVHTQDEVEEANPGDSLVIAGRITDLRKTVVKRGRQSGREMAMVRARFGLDTFDLTLFPDVYDRYQVLLEAGRGIIVTGERDDRESIIVKAMMGIDEWVADTRAKETQNVAG